ncbi:MAG: Type II secretion system protein E [uncultured bacterium]|nr:MAG: Type II secretion system protein E [uncultured bacterium]
MPIDEKKLAKLLVETKILTPANLNKLVEEAKSANATLKTVLLDKKILNEERLAELIAKTFGVEYISLKKIQIPKDILLIIPEPLVKKHKIAAFKKTDTELFVAMVDPDDLATIESIKKKTGLVIKSFYTTPTDIEGIVKLYRQSIKSKFDEIIKNAKLAKQDETLEKAAQDLPVIRIVDTLLDDAILQDSSDIHMEPAEKEVIVRYRIDGILHDIISLPKTILPALVARIKILTNLKIDENRLPQDGRFKKQTEDYNVSFRVSIIPVYDGEKVVMRILHEGQKVLTLEQLGFQHSALEKVRRNIKRPHGMILATGPTGSGKTTTLYSIMHILNKAEVNITTIEDPIEYRMPRINQTQINTRIGLTFAKGLRSLLRQDPDVMMVGEIRDNETAEIAVHAALTGHIVLSTLHTNNAAGTLPRFLDMKVEPFLAASTVNTVIAQRLLRKICSNCIESFVPDKDFLEMLKKEFNLEKIFKIMKRERLTKTEPSLDNLKFYKGKGCSQCSNEGYKGRIGIYEVLEITEEIQDLVVKNSSSDTIQKKAVELGMITMEQDGFIKAATGVTTIEEVLRVTKE